MSIRLPLLHEPTVQEVLEQVLKRGTSIATDELISFDCFTRIFCSCGRHTYGDLEGDKLTKENFVFDCPEKHRDYWFTTYKGLLARRQVRHDRHAGRTSSVCVGCECKTQYWTSNVSFLGIGHHQVLDLSRPCVPGGPDQYSLPVKPLWQGADYCTRLIWTVHDMASHYLIERKDGLWVYVHTRDCGATPGYRCPHLKATSVYWSDSFEVVWNRYMTQVVRQSFWKSWTGAEDDLREPYATNYYGVQKRRDPDEEEGTTEDV